jgi:hypothetical protein
MSKRSPIRLYDRHNAYPLVFKRLGYVAILVHHSYFPISQIQYNGVI